MPDGVPDQNDIIYRQILSNYQTQQRQLDDLTRLLSGFTSQQVAAFDLAGVPSCWDILSRRAGSWQGITAPGSTPTPFQITTRSDPSNPGQFQYQVDPDSDLLLSLEPNNWQAITGMGTWYSLANTTPITFSGSTPSGFYCYDIIVLNIPVSSYVISSASIQSRIQGSNLFDPTLLPWDSSGNAFVSQSGTAPYPQTGINFLLGYTVQPTSGGGASPTVIQACSNHLLIENIPIDINGYPALYPTVAPYRRFGLLTP